MAWIIENAGTIYGIASSIVGTAAVIAAATPNTTDDGIVSAARKVLDLLAFNVGFAKNR